MKTQRRGNRAEQLALRFLRQRGLQHITSNYRARCGEIDLIMREGQTIVFVEVRYRANDRYGGAAASVDLRKQRKLIRTAQHWLQTRHDEPACRFDVIAIDATDRIDWIPHAFSA